MVQFLWLLAFNIVLAAFCTGWLVRLFLKRNRDLKLRRDKLKHLTEPDFSALEDNDFVPLIVAKPNRHGTSFDRCGDDSDLLFQESLDDRKRAYDDLDSGDEAQYTGVVEPNPLFGSRGSVRQSCVRAMRHMDRCADATYKRRDYTEAEAFALAALREVNINMKRDHWYAPFVLNWLGYLRYEQGFSVEARDYWEQAEQGALEWFEQCHDLLPDIRKNLRAFHDNF
ncbi:MAG: hypothetical protein SGJ27_13205 [Candidatus Melainabacteria bacterium]|nr:hypothetical protein [Candidatus Melainabacteria bacterium]